MGAGTDQAVTSRIKLQANSHFSKVEVSKLNTEVRLSLESQKLVLGVKV